MLENCEATGSRATEVYREDIIWFFYEIMAAEVKEAF